MFNFILIEKGEKIMKKIDKIDMFLFVCIIIGCVFGLAFTAVDWILGEEIIWLKVITAIFIEIPSVSLIATFSSDILLKIINNHKEKKKGNKYEKK